MYRKAFFIVLVFFFHVHNSFGQGLDVRGHFLVDSIKIGSVFPYYMAVRYAKNTHILFPDSTYSFTPFDIHHKKFFPTQTVGDSSYDSVVYFLSSFEIDSIQRLRLPVFVIHSQDCTKVYAKEDSVFFKALVAHTPDSVSLRKLPLKTNTAYQVVIQEWNYLFIGLIGGAGVFLVVGVWLVFGKKIRTYFILKKLHREYARFTRYFEENLQQLQLGYSPEKASFMLFYWKKYIGQLTAMPIATCTTKEIFHYMRDPSLHKALQVIDKKIYSGSSPIEGEFFTQLQRFSTDRFHEKIMKVKNG